MTKSRFFVKILIPYQGKSILVSTTLLRFKFVAVEKENVFRYYVRDLIFWWSWESTFGETIPILGAYTHYTGTQDCTKQHNLPYSYRLDAAHFGINIQLRELFYRKQRAPCNMTCETCYRNQVVRGHDHAINLSWSWDNRQAKKVKNKLKSNIF